MTGEKQSENGAALGESTSEESESRLYPLSSVTMNTLFYVGLFAWAGIMLVSALEWGWQDKLFPLTFTGIALLLIVIHLIVLHFGDRLRQFLPDTAETGSDQLGFDETGETEARTGRVRERYELIMIVWVIALPVCLYVIGFLYTIPLYTAAFIWYFNEDPRTATMAAIVATAVVYGLFIEILGIRLPSGLLFG